MGLFNPALPSRGGTRSIAPSATSLSAVAAAHVAAVVGLVTFVPAEKIAAFVQPLTVRVLELAPELPKARPEPPRPRVQAPVVAPPPVMAVATPAPAAAPVEFVVAPQPPAPPAPPAAAPEPAAPVTQARFDAEYLNNPKPAYPVSSRRLGEQGKVVLRVLVAPEGRPTEIEIKSSSSFPRLDNAAREAVARWRFVPAKRGDEPITAWVLVPVVFSLEG